MISKSFTHLLGAQASTRGVDAVLCIVRAFCGVAFLQHGWGKVRNVGAFSEEHSLPVALGGAAAYVQFLGGVLLVLGLLTRPAALGIGVTMAVAVVTLIRAGESFINPGGHSWESAALYTLLFGGFVAVGGGRFSLDHALWTRRFAGNYKQGRAPAGGTKP